MSSDIVDINFDNALANLYLYIENLKRNPNHNKQKTEEYGRYLLSLVRRFPFVIKAWSDDPRGVEYVKQEALRRIAAIIDRNPPGLYPIIQT
jgi:hypothetical protein